jgi:hypothetical protein
VAVFGAFYIPLFNSGVIPIRLTTTMPNEKKRKPQTEQFPNLMEKPASIGKMGIASQGRIYGK